MFTERQRLSLLELAACVCILSGLLTLQGSPGRATISPIFIAGAVLAIYCLWREREMRKASDINELRRAVTPPGPTPQPVPLIGKVLIGLIVGGALLMLLLIYIGLSGGP